MLTFYKSAEGSNKSIIYKTPEMSLNHPTALQLGSELYSILGMNGSDTVDYVCMTCNVQVIDPQKAPNYQ